MNETMNYVGIDVHKQSFQAAVVDQTGSCLEEFRLRNNREGIQQLIERVGYYGSFQAVVESSANYWTKLFDVMQENHVSIKLSNPYKTKAIAEAKVKTDKIDARTLAQLLRADLVAECYVPSKENREKRALIRERASLTKIRTEHRNKIHDLLAKYEHTHDFSDLFGQRGMEWLKTLKLSQYDQIILDTNLRLLESFDAEIEKLSIEIAKLAINHTDENQQNQIRLLLGLKGIDYYGAMILLSEIGDIKRFATPEKLVSWAGLAPRTHQSGETSYNGHITKKGSSRVRWILGQAAQTARLYDPKFKTFYERIAAKKGHNKALVATMRKMLVVIWTILTKNERYSGEDQELTERKYKRLIRIST
jgi:transposase